jgi:arylsulfatase A-like enzyme
MERKGVMTDRVQRLREIYAGMVTLIDHELDRLVSALTARRAAENTVLIFMSDHGDYLGDHSMVRKSPAMYDCLIRIPFLVWAPGRFRPRRQRGTFVESIDVAPTLLELAGASIPDAMEGMSLTKLLSGKTNRHKDAVFGIYGLEGSAATSEAEAAAISAAASRHTNDPWNGQGVMQGRFAMVRTVDCKLVHYRGGEGELYDLARDPGETVNLWSDVRFGDARRRLENCLLDWALETFTVSPPVGGRS